MYPNRELTRLAAQKAVLRREITYRRIQCVAAAACVAQPLAWLDRMRELWRRLSSFPLFAALPMGLLVQRIFFRRQKFLPALLRWGPLVSHSISAAVRSRFKPSVRARQKG
jgi:hypothetical protein